MGGMTHIGLLGGTFDPPHIGHLLLAETALSQLGLEQIWFIPAGQPPHKTGQEVTPVHHRQAMTRLAIADHPCFRLDNSDCERPAPHYTATLLPILRQRWPLAQFWLIIGSDSLQAFARWHAPQEIIRHCRLAVLLRPGYTPNWPSLEQTIPHLSQATDWLDGPQILLSSSQLRRWIPAGRNLTYLLPGRVIQYIREHQLYADDCGK